MSLLSRNFTRMSLIAAILSLLISSNLCFAAQSLSAPQAFRASFKGSVVITNPSSATVNGSGNVYPLGLMYNSGVASFTPDLNNICQNGVRNVMQVTLSSTPDPKYSKDLLYITIYDITCPLNSAGSAIQGDGTYVINGGIGNYKGAVGSGIFVGSGDLSVGQFNWNFIGMIQLPN